MTSPRLLILTLGPVGPRMAGLAIRACELARVAAAHADVTIAASEITGPVDVPATLTTYHRHDDRTLRAHLRDADVVLAQPQWPLVAHALRRSGAQLIYDLSCPEPLEALETHSRQPLGRRRAVNAVVVDRVVAAARDADLIIASTERQLNLWIGMLLGERLLRPAAYDRDPSLERRLAIVPHGLPDSEPVATGTPGPRGLAGVGPDDEVVLWGSAIWPWLDAETAIRGIALLARRRPQVRLVVMSRVDMQGADKATAAAETLARQLGVFGSHVVFNDGWVPYDERQDWLLASDVALATHPRHLETRFSFRTRYLDCFWTGLPLVCTEGDALADRVAREGLGATVAAGDPEAVAAAVERVLDRRRGAYAPALAAAADSLRWSRAAAPIAAFLQDRSPRPPRLGEGVPAEPGSVARDGVYRTLKRVLNATGARDFPRA